MSQCFGAGCGSLDRSAKRCCAGVWLAAAALAGAVGCADEPTPFCQSWLGRPEPEREDLVGDAVRGGSESSRGSGPSNLNFIRCVGREVLVRRGAITEACELYGELEAGVVVGTLISSGVRSCLDLDQLRNAPD